MPAYNTSPNRMIEKQVAAVARALAVEKRETLDRLKAEYAQLSRPDFLWHYLLQSFATMGRAAGAIGLIDNKTNYNKVRYEALTRLTPSARAAQVETTCRAAKIRMPSIKTQYILGCFEKVRKLGGLEAAKAALFARRGRAAKIEFLKSFPGIGDKYARNILMDVYHEDFRDSIAVDSRISKLSATWGLRFDSYQEHESFYLRIAAQAGLNGWELDRLLFQFTDEFLRRVKTHLCDSSCF